MRRDKGLVPGEFLEAPCRGEGLNAVQGESLNASNNCPEEAVDGPVAAV